MLTHRENELLCRVEGDAPMGKLMCQHWTPVEFEQDAEAIGTGAKAIPQTFCSYQAVVPKETDWRVYGARYVSAKHALPDDESAAIATDYQVRQ